MNTPAPLSQGILVALEGIDGCGKSTLARTLAERLRQAGLAVDATREPTDGPWGQRLRASARLGRLSPQEELRHFVEDRRQHVREELLPGLAAGRVVIVDRYYFSSVAYQGARGLDPAEIRRQNEEFAPPPDLLLILEVEPAVGLARVRGRGAAVDLFEQEAQQRRTAQIFAELAAPGLVRLDATQPPAALVVAALAALLAGPLFDRCCARRAELAACVGPVCPAHADRCRWPELVRRLSAG